MSRSNQEIKISLPIPDTLNLDRLADFSFDDPVWKHTPLRDLHKSLELRLLEQIIVIFLESLAEIDWHADQSPSHCLKFLTLEKLFSQLTTNTLTVENPNRLVRAYLHILSYFRPETSYLRLDWRGKNMYTPDRILLSSLTDCSDLIIHQSLIELIAVCYQVYPFPPYVLLEIIKLVKPPIIFEHPHRLAPTDSLLIKTINQVKKSVDHIYYHKQIDRVQRFKSAQFFKVTDWHLQWKQDLIREYFPEQANQFTTDQFRQYLEIDQVVSKAINLDYQKHKRRKTSGDDFQPNSNQSDSN